MGFTLCRMQRLQIALWKAMDSLTIDEGQGTCTKDIRKLSSETYDMYCGHPTNKRNSPAGYYEALFNIV